MAWHVVKRTTTPTGKVALTWQRLEADKALQQCVIEAGENEYSEPYACWSSIWRQPLYTIDFQMGLWLAVP